MKDTLRDNVSTLIKEVNIIGEMLHSVVIDLHAIRKKIISDSEENEKEGNKTYIFSITKAIRNEDSTFHITDQYLNVELDETEMKKFEKLLKEFKLC